MLSASFKSNSVEWSVIYKDFEMFSLIAITMLLILNMKSCICSWATWFSKVAESPTSPKLYPAQLEQFLNA